MDIHTWKVARDGVNIAQVLTFTPSLESKKVITKAIDNTVYVQTLGEAGKKAELSIFCTLTEMSLVNLAEGDGALITVIYRDNLYHGYIEEAPDWEALIPGEWYQGSFTLLIEEVEDYETTIS